MTNELIEAKATADRAAVRMALDRRFVEGEVSCKLLLPEAPTDDLVDLLRREGVGVLVRDGDGFHELAAETHQP